jgi:hypothetical protein
MIPPPAKDIDDLANTDNGQEIFAESINQAID